MTNIRFTSNDLLKNDFCQEVLEVLRLRYGITHQGWGGKHVHLQQEDPTKFRARRRVIIATGGYTGSQEMRQEHSRKPTVELGLGLPGNVGEGIRPGLSAGGRLDHNSEDTGFYVPMSVFSNETGGKVLWGHFMLDRPKPGSVQHVANPDLVVVIHGMGGMP